MEKIQRKSLSNNLLFFGLFFSASLSWAFEGYPEDANYDLNWVRGSYTLTKSRGLFSIIPKYTNLFFFIHDKWSDSLFAPKTDGDCPKTLQVDSLAQMGMKPYLAKTSTLGRLTKRFPDLSRMTVELGRNSQFNTRSQSSRYYDIKGYWYAERRSQTIPDPSIFSSPLSEKQIEDLRTTKYSGSSTYHFNEDREANVTLSFIKTAERTRSYPKVSSPTIFGETTILAHQRQGWVDICKYKKKLD